MQGGLQGALDVVRMLREKYPDMFFVMQNAVGDNTLEGVTGAWLSQSCLTAW